MSEIMKKWNEKWKAQRLQLLFTELGEKEKNFFENLELLKVTKAEYMNEYSDEGHTFDCIIQVLHEGTSYYIGEEYGSFFIDSDGYMHYPKSWSNFFQIQDDSYQKKNDYNKKINTFLKEFAFEAIPDEIEEEASAKQLEIDSKTHIGMKSIGLEYNKEDRQYYVVFDNGMKIPYKTEEEHVTELCY